MVQEDPLGKGIATHFSILARRIPWTEEPGGLPSMESQRVGHDLATKQLHNRKFYTGVKKINGLENNLESLHLDSIKILSFSKDFILISQKLLQNFTLETY